MIWKGMVFFLLAFTICLVAFSETMFVKVDTANVRSGPGTGYSVENKLYRGQKLQTTEVSGKWAKINSSSTNPRWVHMDLLSRTKPAAKPKISSDNVNDRRLSALPVRAAYGMSNREVTALRRFALELLESRKCRSIEDGDMSVNRPNQMYILCNGMKKHYASVSKYAE